MKMCVRRPSLQRRICSERPVFSPRYFAFSFSFSLYYARTCAELMGVRVYAQEAEQDGMRFGFRRFFFFKYQYFLDL